MLRVSISRIKPGKEESLRAWLAELMQRRDEVLETFRHETTRHEQAFILDGIDGPLLLYVMEVEDPERGRHAFQTSTLPIDDEHKLIMSDVIDEVLALTPLYNCALPDEDGTS